MFLLSLSKILQTEIPNDIPIRRLDKDAEVPLGTRSLAIEMEAAGKCLQPVRAEDSDSSSKWLRLNHHVWFVIFCMKRGFLLQGN